MDTTPQFHLLEKTKIPAQVTHIQNHMKATNGAMPFPATGRRPHGQR